MNSFSLDTLTVQLSTISRCDRWQAHQRFQDLSIPSYCSADGKISVEVTSPVAAMQLRSVVQQLTCSRAELIDWLDRCWTDD